MLDRSPRRSVSKSKPCWRGLGQHPRYPTDIGLIDDSNWKGIANVSRNRKLRNRADRLGRLHIWTARAAFRTHAIVRYNRLCEFDRRICALISMAKRLRLNSWLFRDDAFAVQHIDPMYRICVDCQGCWTIGTGPNRDWCRGHSHCHRIGPRR